MIDLTNMEVFIWILGVIVASSLILVIYACILRRHIVNNGTTTKVSADADDVKSRNCCIEDKEQDVYKNEYMKKYHDALERKDADEMEAALIANRKNCSNANSWCLTEVFCPDCPFGGLTVKSGRAGM